MKEILQKHNEHRKLSTLVENRTIYNCSNAELNLFETHQVAEKVQLNFDYPVIASMLTGKKIMHLANQSPFDFFPGESVIMPANEAMVIDFPLASMNEPTQCLALGFDKTTINEVVSLFNNESAIEGEELSLTLDNDSSHLLNNYDVHHLIQRLFYTFTTVQSKSKDVLVNLMSKELIVRLLQTKARKYLLDPFKKERMDSRIELAISFIDHSFTNRDFSIADVAKKVCMSESNFFRKFKKILGLTPSDYINSKRIELSKQLLVNNLKLSVSDIAHQSGYNNVSYFVRKFRELEKCSPTMHRKKYSYLISH